METFIGQKPSAWVPVAMSLSALVLVASQLRIHGIALPIIAFFAFRWLRRAPWKAAIVLVTQALAAAAAAVPVYMLGW